MTQTQEFETTSSAEADGKHEKKLLDRARDALLEAGFEREAAGRYVDWMLRYILFHHKRHPLELGGRGDRSVDTASVLRNTPIKAEVVIFLSPILLSHPLQNPSFYRSSTMLATGSGVTTRETRSPC